MNTLPTHEHQTVLTREDERENLIAFALTARTPDDIARAKQKLDAWLRRYPEDHSLEDAYSVLALRGNAC